jgi:hypothetical protein
VASPRDSAVVGFELETARSQAEASTTEPSGDNVSVTEQWLNHQQKQVQGGGTGGGAGGAGLVPSSQYSPANVSKIGPIGRLWTKKKYFGRKFCDVKIWFCLCGGHFGIDCSVFY